MTSAADLEAEAIAASPSLAGFDFQTARLRTAGAIETAAVIRELLEGNVSASAVLRARAEALLAAYEAA